MGQPSSVLLFRSVDFNQFQLVLEAAYSDFHDQQLLVGLVQMLWDRAEPSGYLHHPNPDSLRRGWFGRQCSGVTRVGGDGGS